jgi:Peptidase propeptide and YPEB domain
MKYIQIALVAAGIIGSATSLLADTPVTPAEEEKIKASLEALGCTGGKIEKEDEDGPLLYEIDDAKCKNGKYDVKLDKNFNVIIMVRD